MQELQVNRLITIGYMLAGAVNILGILWVSSVFSEPLFHKLSPDVFSPFGSFMVMVWGFAYLAVANKAAQMGGIALVFAAEKFVYVYTWFVWINNKSDMLQMIGAESYLISLFYSFYGLVDLAFGLFFLWVGVRSFMKDSA